MTSDVDHTIVFVKVWGAQYREDPAFRSSVEVHRKLARGDRKRLNDLMRTTADRINRLMSPPTRDRSSW